MGNTQILNIINPFDHVDDNTLSSDLSESFDFNTDSPIEINRVFSSPHESQIACEYCQEYSLPEAHEEHVRTCSCNPENLQSALNFWSQSENNGILSSAKSSLPKVSCKFCNELCYLKYQNDHQRICPKNPENIKINCRYCARTFNLVVYDNHFECCAETHRSRREAEQSGAHSKSQLINMRKIKTNPDIQMDCCKGVARTGLDHKDTECPICLERINMTFDLTVLNCRHKFHRECLNSWAKRQRKCPCCRKEFF